MSNSNNTDNSNKPDNSPVLNQASTNSAAELSADQVIAYLRENPNFFKTHPQLLTDLNFTHETGGAVSIIQRQVELLRGHHKTTRQRLADLSSIAKTNEALLGRMRTLSIATASASTPKAILEGLTQAIKEGFGLDSVYLVVEHKNWPMSTANVIGMTPENLGHLRNAVYNLSVFVGRPPAKVRDMVLQDKEAETASIAMTRFKYKGVDTYLIIGSQDGDHFTNDMGTDFVSYIGEYLEAMLAR